MAERWFSIGEIAAHRGVGWDVFCKCVERKETSTHKLGRLSIPVALKADQRPKARHTAQQKMEGCTSLTKRLLN